MSESGKHAQRRDRVRSGRRLPVLPVLLVAASVAVAVTLWQAWEQEPDDTGPVAEENLRFSTADAIGADWTAPDGNRYRVSVAPKVTGVVRAGECLQSAPADRVNVAFQVRIENRGTKAAPVPDLRFGVNLGPRGTVRASVLTLERSSRAVEVSPRPGSDCATAWRVDPDGRAKIPAKKSVTLAGLVGGVDPGPTKAATGLVVVVRYVTASTDAPDGSAAQEFVVPFQLASG